MSRFLAANFPGDVNWLTCTKCLFAIQLPGDQIIAHVTVGQMQIANIMHCNWIDVICGAPAMTLIVTELNGTLNLPDWKCLKMKIDFQAKLIQCILSAITF